MKQRDILAEKKKVKGYFIWRLLIICAFVLLYGFLAFRFVSTSGYEVMSEEILGILPLLLPALLVVITVRIFAIPDAAGVKEYPGLKRTIMMIFLSCLVLSIIFPLLPLAGIFSPAEKAKLGIVLFVFSLNMLIAYVLIVNSSMGDALRRLFNRSAFHFVWGGRDADPHVAEKTNKKISSMGQLVIHSIHQDDEKTFIAGLNKIDALGNMIQESSMKIESEILNELFKTMIINYRWIASECIKAKWENYLALIFSKTDALGKMILASSKLDLKSLNDIFKTIIVNYRCTASECIKAKWEDHLSLIFSNMTNLIKYGMSLENHITSKINYTIAVKEMEKVGVMSIKNNMHPLGSEIIDNIGQVGELSLNCNLDHPPDIEVLTALQEIGAESAKRRLENLCLEALIRIEFLGVEAQDEFQFMIDSERKEEIKKVFQNALKSHWIVSAFLFKSIPETGDWLKDTRKRMEDVFKKDYGDAYKQALKEMDMTSFVGKKILSDYK